MKHSCLINGYDRLNLTKLDVLDKLSEIKIAVKYLVDGKELASFPGSSEFKFLLFNQTKGLQQRTWTCCPRWTCCMLLYRDGNRQSQALEVLRSCRKDVKGILGSLRLSSTYR